MEMTVGASTLDDYKAQVAGKADAYLGHLVWYSMSGVKIKHEALLTKLGDRFIDIATPKVPSDADVFRRACSSVTSNKIPTGIDGVFNNYLIRSTDENDPQVIRRLVIEETVDRKGKRLSYSECYFIDFERATSKVSFGKIGLDENVPATTLCKEVQSEYISWRGCLNSQSIREMIRTALLDNGATKVRDGGGVYFLGDSKSDLVGKLEAFVNIDLAGESTFHSLPLVDDRKQRSMIQRAFEAETSDAIDTLLGEIRELIAKPKGISQDKYAAMMLQYKKLTDQTNEYAGLLETTLDTTQSRLSLFQSSILSLRKQIR